MFLTIIFKRKRNLLIISKIQNRTRKEVFDDFTIAELFSDSWLPNFQRDDVFVHKPKKKYSNENVDCKITYLQTYYLRKQRTDFDFLERTNSKMVPKKKRNTENKIFSK